MKNDGITVTRPPDNLEICQQARVSCVVEPRGIEPLTSSLRTMRSPN